MRSAMLALLFVVTNRIGFRSLLIRLQFAICCWCVHRRVYLHTATLSAFAYSPPTHNQHGWVLTQAMCLLVAATFRGLPIPMRVGR